jgi:hypothetical protein
VVVCVCGVTTQHKATVARTSQCMQRMLGQGSCSQRPAGMLPSLAGMRASGPPRPSSPRMQAPTAASWLRSMPPPCSSHLRMAKV